MRLKTYTTKDHNDFSIKIITVDGFQDREENVITISTFRYNG